jgi:hypothetical protein
MSQSHVNNNLFIEEHGYKIVHWGKDMQTNPKIRKSLAFTMVVLCVGIGIIPMVGSLSKGKDGINIKTCACGSRDNDTTPPVTTATLNPPSPNGMNGWYVSLITVTLTATDDLSGVNATFYRINDMDWQLYITPFIIDHDGMYSVKFYSTDFAGNVETIKSVNGVHP